MKIILLENQIELIMKSLQNYHYIDPLKQQLIYATYESLQEQLNLAKQELLSDTECNKNVTNFFKKPIDIA